MISTLILAAVAQQSTFFPFVIPWDDAVKGTATDVSRLNTAPAGKNGRIVARKGVLVEAKTERRVRFLGTNFTTRAAFPDHATADRVAARLAKLGINIVRFHHLQNSWDKEKGMIWKKGREMLELDPKQLDRLDYLIAALKRNGIYANINLQTTRDYLPEMGFPESVRRLPWGFAKRVDKWNRRMIQLQKEYARQLIGRKNPYTGLKYTEDPAVMVVEINNENSLVGAPWETLAGGLEQVPEPFQGELRTLWNTWLRAKYRSDEQLTTSWSRSKTPTGPNIITPERSWSFERANGADAAYEGGVNREGGHYSAEVRKLAGPEWSLQANLAGLDLKDGETYTLTFRAKANPPREMMVHSGLDVSDWHNIGLTNRIHVGTDWQTYSMTFGVEGSRPAHSRIGFWLGSSLGRVEVEGLTLHAGSGNVQLSAGQSLASRNIALPTGQGSPAQQRDFMDFLTATEAAYSKEMRDFLRKDLGYRGLMIDTQISWGGLTGLVREGPMEIADNHAYFHHPEFPGASWDEENWVVRNSPMVDEMVRGRYGELGGLAQYRVEGKPYTVSEYNHPAPNDFRAEMMPLFSSFGALQNWDILYSFDYGSYGPGEPNNRIQGFFAVGSDPAKAAFFPASALIFRAGLVPDAPGKSVLLLPKTPYETAKTAYAAWQQAGGVPDLFTNAISIRTAGVPQPSMLPSAAPRSRPEVDVINEGAPIYRAVAPAARVFVGHVGGKWLDLQGVKLTFGKFGNGFASGTLTAQDQKPIEQSGRMLLTLVGRVENRDMGWNKDRTSVGKAWGDGPTHAEFIPVTVLLPTTATKVWALDGNGRRKARIPAVLSKGRLSFSTTLKHPSLWYEIAR